jgi:hydrogenase maturation protease
MLISGFFNAGALSRQKQKVVQDLCSIKPETLYFKQMDAVKNKTAILALGDANLRDAGTGQFLLGLLDQVALPDEVDTFDCGLQPVCLRDDLPAYHRFVLLTAHSHGDAAGEILFSTIRNDIENVLKGLPHPLRKVKDQLIELYNATQGRSDIEWILIGIEPKYIGPGVAISDDVIKAAPRALHFINDLLRESAPKDPHT